MMFFSDGLDGKMMDQCKDEADSVEKDVLMESAQPADLESAGLELTGEEQKAVAEAGAMPLEDTTVERAHITTRCEGCVGSHTGTGVRVIVHNT